MLEVVLMSWKFQMKNWGSAFKTQLIRETDLMALTGLFSAEGSRSCSFFYWLISGDFYHSRSSPFRCGALLLNKTLNMTYTKLTHFYRPSEIVFHHTTKGEDLDGCLHAYDKGKGCRLNFLPKHKSIHLIQQVFNAFVSRRI